jgi:hypothetical protein
LRIIKADWRCPEFNIIKTSVLLLLNFFYNITPIVNNIFVNFFYINKTWVASLPPIMGADENPLYAAQVVL